MDVGDRAQHGQHDRRPRRAVAKEHLPTVRLDARCDVHAAANAERLDEHLDLARPIRGERDAPRLRVRADARHQKLAHQDDHDHPRRDPRPDHRVGRDEIALRNRREDRRGEEDEPAQDQRLVNQRIHDAAEHADHTPTAGEVAVQNVGQCRNREEVHRPRAGSGDLLGGGAAVQPREDHEEQHREGQAHHRDRIGKSPPKRRLHGSDASDSTPALSSTLVAGNPRQPYIPELGGRLSTAPWP